MNKICLLLLCSLLTFAYPASSDAGHSKTNTPQTPTSDDDNIIDWLWHRSDLAFHAGDYPRAIGLHKAIVALDPHDVQSYSVAAWLMWSLGNGKEAQQHLQRGLDANPQNWEMWDAAGQQDSLQKYFSKAEFAFSQAVKFIPAKEDAQLLRRRWAHAAEQSENPKKAIQIWQQLVEDYPNEAVNINNLNRVLGR